MAVDYSNQILEDYSRVEQAITYLQEHFQEQPSLQTIAQNIGLSEYHFQRLFSRWVGISPKRFLQYLTKEHAKQLLEHSNNLLNVAYETGLSGPGRLHDLFVQCEAVTPGEYKRGGEGLEIQYGFHSSPFGECLLAATERGICFLTFVKNGNHWLALQELRDTWKNANLEEDPQATRQLARQVFESQPEVPRSPLKVILRGTNFQIKVWEALLRIPSGSVVSYQDIAVYLGMPRASRAVGSAVGANPIPYIIPCHRVIRREGSFGNYGGGRARKLAILGWEMAKAGEEIAIGSGQ